MTKRVYKTIPFYYIEIMKRYKTIIDGLYEAFRNASKKEYRNVDEYRFTYNDSNYMILITNSSLGTIIRFGIIDDIANYRKNSLLINAKTEDDIEKVIKNLFEYYVKYVIADQTIIDEVIDSIIEIYEET